MRSCVASREKRCAPSSVLMPSLPLWWQWIEREDAGSAVAIVALFFEKLARSVFFCGEIIGGDELALSNRIVSTAHCYAHLHKRGIVGYPTITPII
mmetsp:Transcript_6772/g.14654  ORF Transcript_6772/g.14654 Transcript_6772/m.14654 type:complete len:96 (-) Transcript_6772:33-320(-)